jgi:uncharacterized protein YprB with RNaseH-like and TPR domain
MLLHTFCHIPGIGAGSERGLWEAGIRHWDDVAGADLPSCRKDKLLRHTEESEARLADGDASFFAEGLNSTEQWRLFSEFKDRVAYLDIETTGLSGRHHEVTTIAVYDGDRVHTYVNGQNLYDFLEDIENYDLLVTYNGKTFDLPFLRAALGAPLDHAHIDLRYLLAGLGLKGGLKSCERQLGLDRGSELADVDGYFAVLLWREFRRNHNDKALETLLAYNSMDVVTLADLMTWAYNEKLAATPFADATLAPPSPPRIPYRADPETLRHIRWSMGWD